MSSTTTYDYAIVGGGLAGCVLASRLREYDGNAKIVLHSRAPRCAKPPGSQPRGRHGLAVSVGANPRLREPRHNVQLWEGPRWWLSYQLR